MRFIMSGDSPILDSLGDMNRMLDAASNLQTGRRNSGMLNAILGAFASAAEPVVEAVLTKPRQSLQQGPN